MTVTSIHDLQPQLAANRRYWTGWAGEQADRPDSDLPIYRTDIPHPLLNGVLRIHDRPLDTAVETAKQRLGGSVWGWWVGADSDEGTAEALLARGATQRAQLPIMAVDLAGVAPADSPAGMKIQTITGRDEMTEYVSAYAGPLGIPGDLGPVVDRELSFGFPDVVRLAGVLDGRIAGTCTLSLGAEVAALYCIATDPACRRQGVASALTLDALRIARQAGRRIATLQASSDGEPVYRRLGFETVGHYRLFGFPA